LYSITLINKTFQPQSIHLSTEAEEMEVEIVGDSNWILPPQSKFEGRFFLVKDQKKVQIPQEKVLVNLSAIGEVFECIETNFMAPVDKKNN
jgi:hypothetical protein